jgi:hypothetical protein
MRLASLTVGFALLASPTFAQTLGGVRLGMSEAATREILRGASATAVDNPSSTTIFNENGDIVANLCDKIVTDIYEDNGSTIPDFTAAVFDLERARGIPTYELVNSRVRGTSFASIEAYWNANFGRIYVKISQWGSDKTSVMRGIRRPSSCDR